MALLNVLVSVAASYALGFRGLHLLFAVLLAWWFLLFLTANLGKYVVPPKVEIAVPLKPISQVCQEVKHDIAQILPGRSQRIELKLDDKKRPQV